MVIANCTTPLWYLRGTTSTLRHKQQIPYIQNYQYQVSHTFTDIKTAVSILEIPLINVCSQMVTKIIKAKRQFTNLVLQFSIHLTDHYPTVWKIAQKKILKS